MVQKYRSCVGGMNDCVGTCVATDWAPSIHSLNVSSLKPFQMALYVQISGNLCWLNELCPCCTWPCSLLACIAEIQGGALHSTAPFSTMTNAKSPEIKKRNAESFRN
jgi:hypothetical protein